MPRIVPISKSERDNFRRGHEAGWTIGEIAVVLQEHGYPVRVYGGYAHMAMDARLKLAGRIDADRPWTPADDAQLRTCIALGRSPGRIASYSHRTVAACEARAEALGLCLPDYVRLPNGVSQVAAPSASRRRRLRRISMPMPSSWRRTSPGDRRPSPAHGAWVHRWRRPDHDPRAVASGVHRHPARPGPLVHF